MGVCVLRVHPLLLSETAGTVVVERTLDLADVVEEETPVLE